jgi:hypothetical protein
MKYFILSSLLLVSFIARAQKETFDLTTYTKPGGWAKTPTEHAIQFSKEDAAKSNYCIIMLYKAMPAIGDGKNNFDAAWSTLIKETVTVSTDPDMLPAETEDGWEIQSGHAAYDHEGNKGLAMLVNATGFKKMVNVVVLTNTDVYEKDITAFLESISLKKPVVTAEPATPSNTTTTNNTAAVTGIWGISSSDQSDFARNNGISGYTKRQYNFNANGTYVFYIKNFSYLHDKLFFTKETGTYQLNGNSLIIIPQKNVFENWTKDSVMSNGRKSGTDKWGRFVSRQNLSLEKKTYRFTKHYFSGTEKWALILQTDTPTKRDGALSNTTEYGSAYLYDAVTSDIFLIDLPKGR